MNPGLFKDSTSLTVAPEVFYGLMTRVSFVSGVTDFVDARTAKSNPNISHGRYVKYPVALYNLWESRPVAGGGRGGIKRAINRELINNDRYVYVKSVDYKFKRAIKRLN